MSPEVAAQSGLSRLSNERPVLGEHQTSNICGLILQNTHADVGLLVTDIYLNSRGAPSSVLGWASAMPGPKRRGRQ